jgi:hypothetical protein
MLGWGSFSHILDKRCDVSLLLSGWDFMVQLVCEAELNGSLWCPVMGHMN